MEFLLAKNPGEVTVDALCLLGLSTKRDNPTTIGMFGSGSKYALAYFVRHGIPIRVFSGLKEIDISLRTVTLGDQKVRVLVFGGKETSITTEFGRHWEFWQAAREITANALDEQGDVILTKEVTPVSGETQFYIGIDSQKAQDFVLNLDHYCYNEDRVLSTVIPASGKHSVKLLSSRLAESLLIYKQGVLCTEIHSSHILDYDFTALSLSEDRTPAAAWRLKREMWGAIAAVDDPVLINSILQECNGRKSLYEAGCDSWDFAPMGDNASDTWKEVLSSKFFAPTSLIPLINDSHHIFLEPHLLRLFQDSGLIPDSQVYSEFVTSGSKSFVFSRIEPEEEVDDELSQYLEVLDKAGYPVQCEVEVIKISDKSSQDDLSNQVWHRISSLKDSKEALRRSTLYIRDTLFDTTSDRILACILGEYLQIQQGLALLDARSALVNLTGSVLARHFGLLNPRY